MSTQKTTPTNGSAKPNLKVETTVSAVNNTKANNEGKPETKLLPVTAVIPIKKEQETESEKFPSLEDRFYKMDTLFSLRERYDKLKETLDKLNKFKLSTDGRNDNIILRDDKSNTFSTSNPEVIAKLVEWLKEDLTKKIKDVDSQIKF